MTATAATKAGKIEQAHHIYREGRYEEALEFYTEALSTVKAKPHRISLHSNRAACYLKLHDFRKAAEECTSVLVLDHQHTGALMLRAQTLVTMEEYQSALFDVNRLVEMNPLCDVYRNLQARLRTQLTLATIPESEEESLVLEEDVVEEENRNNEQQKIATEDVNKKFESPKKANVVETHVNGAKENVARKLGTTRNKPENMVLDDPNMKDGVIKKIEISKPGNHVMQKSNVEDLASAHPKGWEGITKPKGHSGLDYSRWDQVEDDSSEDEEEEQQPPCRFRVRTVGV